MTTFNETYKDCTIDLAENGQLSINSKLIEYHYDSGEKAYYCKYLPYTQYPDQVTLAKAIITHSEEFGGP